MNFNERLREQMSNVVFCYAKDGGQGFVNKNECCSIESEKCCQAYKDREKFFKYMQEVEYGDFKKLSEIKRQIKHEFKDSQWWKDNVIE